MKKMIVIVTLIMSLKPILPVFEYVLNYEYIISELCENKATPELNCNGKCHLEKELAKAAETNSENSDKKIVFQHTEIVFFQEIINFEIRQVYFLNKTKVSNYYSNFYFHLNDCCVFHPPIQSWV